jgi:hypothetical protein
MKLIHIPATLVIAVADDVTEQDVIQHLQYSPGRESSVPSSAAFVDALNDTLTTNSEGELPANTLILQAELLVDP